MSECRLQKTFSPEEKARLWEVYKASFRPLEAVCAQLQSCYNEKAFIAALEDPDSQVFVLRDGQTIIGVGLAVGDLDKAAVAYVSPETYRQKYGEYASSGRIWYFTALAIHPDWQGAGHSLSLLVPMAEYVMERRGMVGLDFSWETNKDLPEMILNVVKWVASSDPKRFHHITPTYERVGVQEFGVLRPM